MECVSGYVCKGRNIATKCKLFAVLTENFIDICKTNMTVNRGTLQCSQMWTKKQTDMIAK